MLECMGSVTFSGLLSNSVILGSVCIISMWLYNDFKQARFYTTLKVRDIFHCNRCHYIYANIQTQHITKCPKCGFRNIPLQF